MASNDFKVKNGLVVETTATIRSSARTNTTNSGALIVGGGIGVGGGGFFGGTVTATTFVGAFIGAVTQVNTVQQATNATYYPTFVDANNASASAESLFTTSSFAINPSTGNVGIGTSSPTSKLHVSGTAQITGITTVSNTTVASSTVTGALQVVGGAGIGGDLYVGGTINALNSSTTALVVKSNINMVSPDAASTITIRMLNSDAISFSGSSGQLFSITDSMTGTIFAVNDISGVPSIEVYDTGEVRLAETFGYVSIPNSTGVSSTTTGALRIYGGIGVGGGGFFGGAVTATTFVGNLTGTASLASLATTATNLASGSAGSIPIQVSPGVTTFVPIGTSGQVLTAGTNTATWTSFSGLSAGTATNANNILTVLQQSNATYYPTFVLDNNSTAAYEAVYTTSSFTINPSTGNVGIGTSSPGSKLQVEGTVRFATNGAGANYLEFQRTTSNQWKLTSDGVGDIISFAGNSVVLLQDTIVQRGGLTVSPTLAGAQNAINITQTWNTTATVFTLVKGNVTDTASSATSLLMDLQTGGVSRAKISKGGELSLTSNYNGNVVTLTATDRSVQFGTNMGADGFGIRGSLELTRDNGVIRFYNNNGTVLYGIIGADDGAANTLAQRNGANAQTYRLYNTYTNSSNYERAKIGWNSNVLEIGSENLGTGSLRNINLIGGNVGIGTASPASKLHVAGDARITGVTTITNTTAASSTITGAFQVAGGAGIGGDLYVGGQIVAQKLVIEFTTVTTTLIVTDDIIQTTNNTAATSTITGALKVAGGAGIGGALFVGGSVNISSGIASTNTGTGALVIQGGVGINGALNAITKSFNIGHPTKPGMSLRYGSLEGPEFGVYIRGRLTGGNTIELPEYWTKLVDPDSITVNLTPVGSHQKLYVEDIVNNTIVVGNENIFGKTVDCFYTVWAERADIDKLQVESE